MPKEGITSYVSQHHCPNPACEPNGPLPAHHALIVKTKHAWMRTVKVYCPHCLQAHAQSQVAVDGFWRMSGEVERITAPAELAAIRKVVDQRDGTQQLLAS